MNRSKWNPFKPERAEEASRIFAILPPPILVGFKPIP